MASQDAESNSNSAKRDELTNATKKGLFGESKLPANEIVYSELDVNVEIKPVKQEWGTGGGYEITIKNLSLIHI